MMSSTSTSLTMSRTGTGNSQPVQRERHWLGLLSQLCQRDNEDEEWTRLCVTWVALNRSAYTVYVCMCVRSYAHACVSMCVC